MPSLKSRMDEHLIIPAFAVTPNCGGDNMMAAFEREQAFGKESIFYRLCVFADR